MIVAHQHELLAEALGRLLDDLGATVVGSTCDPAALLAHLPNISADVLLLDAGFDRASGPLVALGRIRAAAPEDLRVVMLADALDEPSAIAQVVAGHAVFARRRRGGHRAGVSRRRGCARTRPLRRPTRS